MGLLVACKNEEDPIKIKQLEWSQHYSLILRCSRGANSKIGDGILTKFKLIQALIIVLIV